MKRLSVMGNRRLRPEWRILVVFVLTAVIAGVLFSCFWSVIAKFTPSPSELSTDDAFEALLRAVADGHGVLRLIQELIPSVSLVLSVFLCLKFIDRKRMADIGAGLIDGYRSDLARGLALGAVSMTLIFVVLLLSGSIVLENSLAQPTISWNLLAGVIIFIFVGFSEELYSRAYSISALSEKWSRWTAAVVSSVIFSLLHAGNANVSLGGLANVLLVGLLFAYMFLRSGSVWMPVGYHITWNYFQGYVFGFPVSGGTVQGIYTVGASHNDFLTGGGFGPEGGFLATLVIIIGFYMVWRFTGGGDPLRIVELERVRDQS